MSALYRSWFTYILCVELYCTMTAVKGCMDGHYIVLLSC